MTGISVAAIIAVAIAPKAAWAALAGSAPLTTFSMGDHTYFGEVKLDPSMASMVPISVKASATDPWDSEVTLCRLDMAKRAEDPAALPMFRFWVKASKCGGGAGPSDVGYTTSLKLGALHVMLERTEEDWIRNYAGGAGVDAGSRRAVWRPHGLVFHEARCGSTLVANMLQKVPDAVVYSEAAPPSDVLFRSPAWSRQQRIEALRVIVRAMGRVAGKTRMFFKFQSAVTGLADVVHEAFPDTPFVFLKRDPVEVMSSLLGTVEDAMRRGTDTGRAATGKNTPCTRTIRSPPEGMAPALGFTSDAELQRQGSEMYCAAHIGFVEYNALTTLTKAADDVAGGNGLGSGAAVDYTSLPAIVPRMITDLFGVPLTQEAAAAVLAAADVYSKQTNPRTGANTDVSGKFVPDSETKRETAPPVFAAAAEKLILPRRPKLDAFTLDRAVEARQAPTAKRAQPEALSADEWKEHAAALQQADKEAGKGAAGGGSSPVAGSSSAGSASAAGSRVSMGLAEGDETVELEPTAESVGAPEAYPKMWPLPELLDAWSADDPRVPESYGTYASVRIFDFTKQEDVELAEAYREAEVPFVARGVPNLMRLNREWTDDHLSEVIEGKRHTEMSDSNHFMYYHRGAAAVRKGEYKAATKDMALTYAEWVAKARQVDKKVLEEGAVNRETSHWYFRATGKHAKEGRSVRGAAGPDAFIAKDFRIFDGTSPDNGDQDDIAKSGFFVVDPSSQRGIHCRFGMAGIIAESHYDGGRNFITMVRGAKRYILSPPSECPHYNLLVDGPSARHSATDWGDSTDYKATLAKAQATEVVIRAGDALYVPSFWFHTPISLNTNIQCNTRSGSPPEGSRDIELCGFRIQVTEGGPKRTGTPKAMAPYYPEPTPAPTKDVVV